jgi:hypothetical protein
MRKITKRSAAVIAASALAVGGAGAAWAAWNLTGSGSTSAKAANAQALTIDSVQVVGLSPGSKSDIKFTAKNPNAFPVRITGIDIVSIHSGTAKTCADNNVAAQAPLTLPDSAALTVGPAAGAVPGSKDITVPDAIKMIADAANGCQGAVFSVDLHLDAVSAAV